MRYQKCFLAGALVVAVLASMTSSAHASTFTTIDVPGVAVLETEAFGINDRGQIVGLYYAGGFHGFLLDHGTFTTIDFPGAVFTEGFGINNSGSIVGMYKTAGSREHGFLLDHGTFTTIDFPGAVFTEAFGINDRGQIVGFSSLPGGFLLDHGTFTTIDVPPRSTTPPSGSMTAGRSWACMLILLAGSMASSWAAPPSPPSMCPAR